jgi:hypothetical protein
MASRRGPDNSVRVAITGTLGGVNWANVFFCQLTVSGTPAQADLDAFLTAFQAAYKTRFGPRQITSLSYTQATATLFLPGGGVLQSVVAMTGAGTEAGTAVADNAASKIISWLSTVYWRGGKPRTYLTGVPTGDVTSATSLTAAEIALLKTAATNFRSDVQALTSGAITGTQFGFVSFQSGNVPRTPAVFFPITGATVHPRLGSQRRRLGKWKV